MVSFRNMDNFASDATNSRIEQMKTERFEPVKHFRLGDSVIFDQERWSIHDFRGDGFVLRRNNRFILVEAGELARY